MAGELAIGTQGQIEGQRWGIMLAASIILHLSVFSSVIFLPGLVPSRDIDGIIYEVDLVTMPSAAQDQSSMSQPSSVEETPAKKETAAKKIEAKEEKKTPAEVEKISLAKKKTASKKEETAKTEKKEKTDDATHLSKAIADLQKKTKSEENHLDKAMSRLQSKVGGGAGSASGAQGGTGSLEGLPLRMYQVEVKDRIKSNWSYPAALQNRKDLEATIQLKVKADGTILQSEFKKKSKDTIFDQSVLKAIERSNPLPPFPEGYRKSYEELEINFTLKELLDS